MSPTLPTRPASPWPYALIGWFVVFITGMVCFVIWSFGHRQELVSADYYEQEILFQQQLDRQRRTAGLGARAAIDYDAARAVLRVRLPPAHVPVTDGVIQLYRPADARLDQALALAPDATGVQAVDVARLRPGLWRVRVQWQSGGQQYHLEKAVVIGG
jgi:nitrogen fixation protein FixH